MSSIIFFGVAIHCQKIISQCHRKLLTIFVSITYQCMILLLTEVAFVRPPQITSTEEIDGSFHHNCTISVPGHKRSNFYDVYWNLKSFFLQWKVSISKASVCYTRNKLITNYMKKNIIFWHPSSYMLVPWARFFTSTQYYVNNAQTRTKIPNAFQWI